jgi:plasmid maintenance system antidote protein VapI
MRKIKAINIKTQKECVFDSMKEASEELNIAESSISEICNKKNRITAKGYLFEYIEEESEKEKLQKKYEQLQDRINRKLVIYEKKRVELERYRLKISDLYYDLAKYRERIQ